MKLTFSRAVDVMIRVDDDGRVRLEGVGPRRSGPFANDDAQSVPLVEIAINAQGRIRLSPGTQHRLYACSDRLRYVSHIETTEPNRSTMEITQVDPKSGIQVVTSLVQRWGIEAVTFSNQVQNSGSDPVRLEFVSSVVLTGFTGSADRHGLKDLAVHLAQNCWTAESRWQTLPLEKVGVVDVGAARESVNTTSQGRFGIASAGSWSSSDYLPLGAISDTVTGRTWMWQIEHNGAWQWEVGDQEKDAYLVASGPANSEHQWSHILAPGGRFESVPVTLAVSAAGFDGVVQVMTEHRRAIRRVNRDSAELPIIFNDYMNCLNGDPTSEKLVPLISAASALGCEYFVIDAGWYAEDSGWWDDVGAWTPSKTRFPEGLQSTLERIRRHGMVPGLWLEPEVVGIRSSVASLLPDAAFFMRDGNRVAENGRYHLDFRNAAAIAHLDDVVDRIVRDYGVGYLKLDYNINIGPGTDTGGESPGAGLLGHNRAYLGWLDRVFERYPELVIENCASGGMRTDYAQLQRLSIHSTSDQRDLLLYPPIAASSPAAVAPEQAAVWSYPQASFDDEAIALTMVNSMLGRVHLSGRIDQLSTPQSGLVGEALETYRQYRRSIPSRCPRWPLGLPGWYDSWVALALEGPDDTLIAVWRRKDGPDTCLLPMPWLAAAPGLIEVLYPRSLPIDVGWSDGSGGLEIGLATAPAARLIRVKHSHTSERQKAPNAGRPE